MNPSLEPLTVEITPTSTTGWYDVVGPRTGEASYGAPLEVQLVFTPTVVGVGTHSSSLHVTTTLEGGRTSVYFINTRLDVSRATVGNVRAFMPWASNGQPNFELAKPGFTARTSYAIPDDGSIVVDLPFTMTVRGRSYTDLRIFADGFVVATASAFPANFPNRCLDNQTWPPFSVYGWWSNLSLDLGSTLSTFQPDADHFVIEYDHFISMGSSDPDDRLHFQIVLQRNGQVELKYDRVPEHAPSNLTVGASMVDGRFYNQIVCHVGTTIQVGELPRAQQSILFRPEDIY